MPFQKATPPNNPELHDLAHGWGKIIARRAFGDDGPDLDADFDWVQPVWLQTSRDRKSLNLPEKERVSDCWPRPKALAMGHYSRRRGEM
jgi:hypothetical protein